MKKLLTFGVAFFSLSAFAEYKFYQCTPSGEIAGVQITEASVTIVRGSRDSIKEANLVAISQNRYLLNTMFRGPLRIGKQSGEALLDGKINSRINPFGDVEYLYFKNLREKTSFSDLPETLELSYESLKGPVGNRGGEGFSIQCSLAESK